MGGAIALITLIAAAVGGTNAQGGSPVGVQWKVTVCTKTDGIELPLPEAQVIAAKMFASVGVSIEWHNKWPSCPAEALRVTLDANTPADLTPGALAYAMPYDRTHITVFANRVRKTVAPQRVRYLLAHVLAHEITHILQGINQHSASGVMKAHWDSDDYSQMEQKPLPFTDEDIILIQRGLAGRFLVSHNTAPSQ